MERTVEVKGTGEKHRPEADATGCVPCGESRVIDGEILARGVPIGRLVAGVSFVEMLFFQMQGRYPTGVEARMMEAYLVSLCEHGVTSPSTHGARVAASVRSPLAGSAISFIAGAMGPYHFGALEQAMLELREVVSGGVAIGEHVTRRLASGVRIWGFGHRYHKSSDGTGADASTIERFQEQADPRVRALTALADELGWEGEHTRAARAIGHELYAKKKIPINIDGIGAGLLLDMGFEPTSAMLFVIVGRLPNIARLHLEEQNETPNRFVALATNEDPGFKRTTDRDLRG